MEIGIYRNRCERLNGPDPCPNRAHCECTNCFTALCHTHREHTEREGLLSYDFCNQDCADMLLGRGIHRAAHDEKMRRYEKEEAERWAPRKSRNLKC